MTVSGEALTMLSPEERDELEELVRERESLFDELTARGIVAPPRFQDTIKKLNPSLLEHEHIRKMADVGQRVWSGEIPRLMMFAPPRYWKSEVFSRLFPAHCLKHPPPDLDVPPEFALITHSHGLSTELSEEARDNFEELGGTLKSGTEAKSRWASEEEARMWASGTDGRFLGKGYHIGVIDDPVDPEQARSPTYQKRFERFFPSKFLSRQEPRARLIFVMQRLGVNDPADFLLRREVGERTDLAPQNWHVVVLDEVHSKAPLGRWDGPRGLPPTCTLEPDWRDSGEILAPGRFSRDQVELLRTGAGPVTTATQRDQRPTKPSGDFWLKRWFRTYTELPSDAYNGGKDWDTAYTKNERNSASGYVESYRGPGSDREFPIYIHDVDWDWKEFPGLVSWMASLMGPHYVEGKAAGKSSIQALAAHDIIAEEVGVRGDKFARASAVQPVVSNRRVFVREEVYDRLLNGEVQGLLRVTAESLQNEAHGLDVNDMFVQALWRHLRIGVKEEDNTLWFT